MDRESNKVSFVVQSDSEGVPDSGTVNRNGATCIACETVAPLSYVREQARAGNMGERMTGIVGEGNRKRLFLSPSEFHISTASTAKPARVPVQELPERALGFAVQQYGFVKWNQLFTVRQLTTLTTFSDLLSAVNDSVVEHTGEREYADTVCTYLALTVGRMADMCSSFSRWHNSGDFVTGVFARQAISIIWDFAEGNPFSRSTGNWMAHIEWIAKVVERISANVNPGYVHQADASTTIYADEGPIIVTDPPYYDNIGYADLSDYFYVWLRPLLRDIYPDLFSGILSPKEEEMVATRFRFANHREHFEELMSNTLNLIRERCSPEFPSSVFYAYKQQEEQRRGTASTGWETMLVSLVEAGFQIIGTWPMRTEMGVRVRAMNSNALASSVVLVCRPRPDDAPVAARRQFLNALQSELPAALDHLAREGHIAPTDLRQAAIGPGMEIYSRYSAVNTLSGEPVSVRDALAAINQEIENYFEAQEGELDAESRFCTDWLKGHGYAEGEYGQAEVLSQAMNVAIESDSMTGLLTAEAGSVRLRRMDEYGPDRPLSTSMTAWEGCMRMAYHLNREYGEGVAGAANVARQMVGMGADVESVERLARILYNHYDRKNDSPNAVIFNNLVTSWQDILTQMQEAQAGTQSSFA